MGERQRQVQLTPNDLALKRDTAAIVDPLGGQEKAARFCRVGQQTLSDAASPNVDRFLAIDALRDLEIVNRAQPGWPVLFRQIGAQIGVDVFVRPEAKLCSADWHRLLAELTKEHAEAMGPLMVALADGELCRRDVIERELVREVDDAIATWVTIRALLKMAEGED
ncbi:hypothetical protein O4H52_03190 [Sphingomonadaceae bacterium G21617-S1]|nr:hypothetical protein [Sphingomonadaceae bacterium G21617-S1]